MHPVNTHCWSSRLLVVVLGGSLAGCAAGTAGLRGDSTQLTGYAATRSEAILQTNQKAEDYCRAHHRPVVRVLREDTVYQFVCQD